MLAIAVDSSATQQGSTGARGMDLFLDENGKFSPFPAKLAHEIMGSAEYDRYLGALGELRCDEAAQLLNRAFVAAYPQFPEARWDEQEPDSWGYALWDQFARVRYDEFGYCRGMRSFEEAQEDLKDTPDAAAVYRWTFPPDPELYDNATLKLRDTSLAVIITKAMNDFVPALRKLGELLGEEELFGAMPEAEYFVLQRLCALGEGCAESGGRMAALRARMDIERRRSLEAAAREDGSRIGDLFNLGRAP